jgi:hypothetical protein
MPARFDAAFAKVKELVADFRANEKFHLSPACRIRIFALRKSATTPLVVVSDA